MIDTKLHEDFCRKMTDQGKLIEAGWIALRYTSLPVTAPQVQVDEMRKAFFCGAQHLFASIMSILEPDAEPTPKDLERLTVIASELNRFVDEMKKAKPKSR